MSDLVGNPEDRFSQNEAQLFLVISYLSHCIICYASRLLNNHFCARSIPRQAIQKKVPIIHIMRNPKDVCVSYYHHCQTIPSYDNVDNFSAFLPMFLGENGFCKYLYPYVERLKFILPNQIYFPRSMGILQQYIGLHLFQKILETVKTVYAPCS